MFLMNCWYVAGWDHELIDGRLLAARGRRRALHGYGVTGPADLPRPIVTRLHEELVRILNQPDVRERIVSDGSEPVGSTPEEFRRFMHADLDKWAKLVKESGAKLD